jgi:translation initiation factor 3 subunit B
LWDLRVAKQVNKFSASGKVSDKPVFEWTSDDRYFIRKGSGKTSGAIEVYETSGMQASLLRIPGWNKTALAPHGYIIATFVAASDSVPSRVALYDIKSKKELRAHNLQGGTSCEFFWHSSGDYLVVRVDAGKARKVQNFVLFRMREKGIPTELLDGIKENVVAFAWEPNGTRFCVSTAEGTGVSRVNVQFFDVNDGKAVCVKALEKKPANRIFWAPQGGFVLFADMQSSNGALEFFNANTYETTANDQHFSASSVVWDASGRYVAVVSSHWNNPSGDCGFNLYTFHGVLVQRVLKDRFYQFIWRPRPPSLLSPERQLEIKRNLKTLRHKFLVDERREQQEVHTKETARIDAERVAFDAIMAAALGEYKKETEKRRALRGGYASDSEDLFIETEQVTETVIGEVITKL